MNCNDGFHCPFQWLWFPSLHPKEKWWTIPMFFEIYPFIVFTSTLEKKTWMPSTPWQWLCTWPPPSCYLPTSPLSSEGSTVGKAMRGVQAHATAPWPMLDWPLLVHESITIYSETVFFICCSILDSYVVCVYYIYAQVYIYNVNIIYIVYNICMIN